MGNDDRRALRELLVKVAPGSLLRDGLERVLRAHMGALIVLGDLPEVLEICSGGFHLDAEFTPQRMSELAKMDGAIVLDQAATRIAWANVHLVPDPSVPTSETGTRHRTAERVARSVGVPVVSVSEEMGTITVYRRDLRHLLRPTENLLARAAYLLTTLERFRQRFDEAEAALTASEIGDVVTAAEVAYFLQRSEMVLRIANEVDELLDELGENGRLLRLQLEELVAGVAREQRMLIEDYLSPLDGVRAGPSADDVLQRLSDLGLDDLVVLDRFFGALAGSAAAAGLDVPVEPRGLRQLCKVPDLAEATVAELLGHFPSLHELVRATTSEIAGAAGLSEADARRVKEGLARLAETTILDRYA